MPSIPFLQQTTVGGDSVFAEQATGDGVSGAMSASEDQDGAFIAGGSDLFDAGGAVYWSYVLQSTEDNDTLSSQAAVATSAALSRTEQNDALAGQYSVTTFAALARTDADDTLAAAVSAVSGISGSLAATDTKDSAAVTAEQPLAILVGDITEEGDGLSADAAVRVAAAFSQAEQSDAASGAFVVTTFTALDATEKDDVLDARAAADEISYLDAAITEDADTTTADVSVFVVAAVGISEAADGIVAATQVIVGASAQVLDAPDALAADLLPLTLIGAQLDTADENDVLACAVELGPAPLSLALIQTEHNDLLLGVLAASPDVPLPAALMSLDVNEENEALLASASHAYRVKTRSGRLKSGENTKRKSWL